MYHRGSGTLTCNTSLLGGIASLHSPLVSDPTADPSIEDHKLFWRVNLGVQSSYDEEAIHIMEFSCTVPKDLSQSGQWESLLRDIPPMLVGFFVLSTKRKSQGSNRAFY